MITLLDYGLGNIQAFYNIYKRLNIPCGIADDSHTLLKAEKIILPGVGAFDWAMGLLNKSGMRDALDELVLVKKTPVLGVCVGMQLMAKGSEEGSAEGLGWIDAEVLHFDENLFTGKTYLPHMGWNDVTPFNTGSLFNQMPSSPQFYFLHSYYFKPKRESDILSITEYHNTQFVSSVHANNIYGTQFHPEKSHEWGVQVLKNFAEL